MNNTEPSIKGYGNKYADHQNKNYCARYDVFVLIECKTQNYDVTSKAWRLLSDSVVSLWIEWHFIYAQLYVRWKLNEL